MIEKNWKSLINTDIVEIKNKNENPFSATVNVEPLERGFGVTIGNALRRVLLSSLQGAAITGIQVQGVLHEFSTIPDLKEDVMLAIGYSISENMQLTGSNDSLIPDNQAVDNVEIRNDNIRLSLIYILN